jgi:hypothetical protein
MKKETIFRHELNESIQANAAMNCLKNRNKPQQMNEALPLVAGAVRLAMPLLRPLITKLVKSLVMKAGAKLTGKQVAKMVIKNVSNGKTLMKIGKKVGQTWTEIPAELKQEIANTAINTFKEMRTQKAQPQLATQEQEELAVEQEETTDEKGAFALKLVKKFKNKMTPDYAKRPELFMMLKLQNALKKPRMSLSKEEYHAWAKAICDACESVFGSTQEQEEETSAFDERFAYRKDLRNMANDVTKKAYMIIRKEFGDSMWRRLHMDDCDERGLISQMNDYQKYYNITNPQDIADCMLGRKSVRSFKKSREEQEEVKNVREKLPVQYEEFVLPDIFDMIGDEGISEEEVISRLLVTPELPWEYDEIEEWIAKNFAQEQEEVKLSDSELEDLAYSLAECLTESFIVLEDEDEDYSNLIEAIEKILKKDVPNPNSKKDCYAWCKRWY